MAEPHAAFKALGNPVRWQIATFLARPIRSCCSREDGVCACDLETFLGLSQPTVSHHMKHLVDAGLVQSERRGRWVYYELRPEALGAMSAVLDELARAIEVEAGAPGATV